jgi:hypothetical protein
MTDEIKQNDLVENTIQEGVDTALKELHTCLPGVVETFYPSTQLADIQPTIKSKVNNELVNLPLLTNVPVRFLKSNKFSITFPLETNDEVLIIFAERSIDTWLTYGGIQNPFDFRKHDLSDAFAFPLMYSQKNLISGFSSSDLEIRTTAGTTKFSITPGGEVSIEGVLNINLDATEIILNSGTEPAVKHTTLKGLIDAFITSLNLEFLAVQAGTLPAPIPYVPTPQVLDITAAASPTIKLP